MSMEGHLPTQNGSNRGPVNTNQPSVNEMTGEIYKYLVVNGPKAYSATAFSLHDPVMECWTAIYIIVYWDKAEKQILKICFSWLTPYL